VAYYVVYNFGFLGLAVLCAEVVPSFQYVLQLPSSGLKMEGGCSPTYRFHIGSKGKGVEHDLLNGKGPCLNMLHFVVRVTVGDVDCGAIQWKGTLWLEKSYVDDTGNYSSLF
jgi:hypothetical protein